MIYIAGQENESFTTIEIQDWLSYYKINYKKILPIDFVSNSIPKLSSKDVVWVYKGNAKAMIETNDNKTLSSFLSNEIEILYKDCISPAVQYPNIEVGNLNKLTVLSLADSLEIITPNTIVTTDKQELLAFYNKNEGNIITKTIGEVEAFDFDDRSYTLYTEKMQEEDIESLSNSFFPSLFQTMIEKLYELRCFYIDGEFYSMAIFSANDDQTKVDFRKYNKTKPNRNVPYQLPKELEKKLDSLMIELGLNTGSIDLIKGVNGKYYFLEVNPVGQFGMTSKPCNYYLEEIVANKLRGYD